MHAIHTTSGLIIDSRPSGEAGKVFSIFTRDFGLVTAAAQGIRLEKSKLRPFTQDYSFGTFSLVRGREIWRLTSAQGIDANSQVMRMTRIQSGDLLVRLASLLKRLLQGEEAHPRLFAIVESCALFIEENQDLNEEQLHTLESLTVVRMLHELGYIGDITDLNGHVQSAELSIESLDALKGKRTLMNRHINAALRESHL